MVPLRRVRNWNVALADWAQAQIGQPFAWGETDCGTLVRKGLELVFGQPVLEGVPAYSSETEAALAMQELGSAGAYFERLGLELVDAPRGRSSDIVVRPGRDDNIPRLGLLVSPTAVLTSDPVYGPHAISHRELRKRARFYRL